MDFDPHGPSIVGERSMRVLVAGPHGGQNLGDELILGRIASDISAMGHEVISTSIDSDFTKLRHGVDSVPMLDIRRLRLSALRALESVDALVIGGGDQLQEGALGYPIWGLLPNVAHLVRRSSTLGKPTMIWGVGVGEIDTRYGRWMLTHWVKRSNVITVRDIDSESRLLGLGFDRNKLHLAADPVFDLPRVDHFEARQFLMDLLGRSSTRSPLILLAAANDRSTDLDYLTPLMLGCREVAGVLGGTVVVISMQPQDRFDLKILRHPLFAEDELVRHLPVREYSEFDLQRVFAGADIVVASRMHALIVAATQGTPWLNISRTAKMEALAKMLQRPSLKVDGLDAQSVSEALQILLLNGRGSWTRTEDAAFDALRKRTDLSRRLFQELMSS